MKYLMTVRMRTNGAVLTQHDAELSASDVEGCAFLKAPWLGLTRPDGGKLCVAVSDISFVELIPNKEPAP